MIGSRTLTISNLKTFVSLATHLIPRSKWTWPSKRHHQQKKSFNSCPISITSYYVHCVHVTIRNHYTQTIIIRLLILSKYNIQQFLYINNSVYFQCADVHCQDIANYAISIIMQLLIGHAHTSSTIERYHDRNPVSIKCLSPCGTSAPIKYPCLINLDYLVD